MGRRRATPALIICLACLLTAPILLGASGFAAPAVKKPTAGVSPRGPAPPRPAPPAREPRKQGVRAFLDVATWYLEYEVIMEAHGGGAVFRSVTSARVALDHSDLGPTITRMTHPTSADLLDQLGDSRYWMIHMPEDENMDFQRWMDSLAVRQQLTYRVDTEDEQTTASGIGMLTTGDAGAYQFEVDVKKKIWALKMPTGYYDTRSSFKGVTGEQKRRWGDAWVTERIETGFSTFMPHIKTVQHVADDGTSGWLRGDLPDTVSTIAAVDSFVFTTYGPMEGTVVYHVKLSPTPPVEVELVIHVDRPYVMWRPTGADDELTPGPAPLLVKAVLQKKGGGDPPFKATRFVYKLLNTSKERGVCMNWPPSPLRESTYDLQFVKDLAGTMNPWLDVVENDGQRAVQTGEQMTEARIVVSSFDWGGHGALEIVAELENANMVTATVQGTGERSLKLPRRSDTSNIALWWVTSRGVTNLPDDSDEEDFPKGDGFRGDGFTQWEEYRGFMEGGKWTDASPNRKDVFVLNTQRTVPGIALGIGLYQTITDLAVHAKLVETEVRLDKVINFNHSAGPHLVDQHVIYVREGGIIEDGLGVSHVNEVGTPGTAGAVNIFVHRPLGHAPMAIVAHELLHASNVYHHGERDTKVAWHVSVDDQGRARVTEHGGGLITGPSPTLATVASWVGLGEVQVRFEDGSPADTAGLPDREVIWLGQPFGQHSGNYECVMRYDVASAYPSATESNVRYLVTPQELQGFSLCSSSTGTVVNDPGRRTPQPRYRDAATTAGAGVKLPRGDCKHQIRVNDMGDEPKR